MQLYIRLEAPFEWVRVNGRKVESFGEVASPADYPVSADYEVIGVVPGTLVTAHRVSLPAKSRKQFQTALPYALEETVSEEIDDLHFVVPQWQPGQACTVLVVAKQHIQRWQALADDNRLPVNTLVPDYALLPIHDAADCTLCRQDERVLTNHEGGFGVSLDTEFIESWLMDVPVSSVIAVNDQQLTEQLIERHPDRDFRHWPIGEKMAHWLEYPRVMELDLWSDAYRPSVNSLDWRSFSLPLIIFGIAIAALFLFDTYRYFSLHAEVRSIDAEMQDIIKRTFPEIDTVEVNNERYIMQQALERRRGPVISRGMHTLLAETSAVLRREKITLSNIVYRDSELVITCQLNDFSQVDKITRQLNSRPAISATLQSSASDDGEIVASYALTES